MQTNILLAIEIFIVFFLKLKQNKDEIESKVN